MANNPSSNSITAIIIARNEEAMLANCLKTVAWCDDIIVIDNGSHDATVEIAQEYNAQIIHFSSQSFAALREAALAYVKTNWLFYLDADERVTPDLAKELQVKIEVGVADAFCFHRKNFFFGQAFEFTGTQKDWVTRVFLKSKLLGWHGSIHESPLFEGKTERLVHPLWHFTHRTTQDGLYKSADWTHREAQLLYKAAIPTVGFSVIVRKTVAEFFKKAIRDGGYRDGTAGLIESLIQGFNRALVYIQVWELQRQPSISKRYKELEESLHSLWKKN